MLCSKNSVKWIVLVSLVSLLFLVFSSAHADPTIPATDNITDWQYSSIYNSSWLSENFTSTWLKGDAPFGDPLYFTVNTSADYSHIYVRKLITLNDSTQGVIKVRAENNLKCYVNGNQVAERHGFIQKGNQFYNCYSQFFADGCRAGNGAYYYTGYNDQNNFFYVDVSKYLKKGNNVIACEAWVDNNAYLYKISSRTYYMNGRLYLDTNFFNLDKASIFWSKTDTNFYKLSNNASAEYQTFTCGSYGCLDHQTNAVKDAEYWLGPWQWGNLPVSDGNYFRWTDLRCQPGGGSCDYINPIWPYDATNLYIKKWVWSDANATKSLQISDTKKPDCYVNEKKVNFTNYNSPYWRYETNIELKAGQNLIACKSPKLKMNSFDMRIAEQNGPLTIVFVDADLTPEVGKETIFTVTLDNYSHPESNVALTLEAWGQTDYQLLLTSTGSGTATFSFVPVEAGNYDLLITAMDMYDYDTANFSSSFDVVAPVVSGGEQYGFLPLSGNSNDRENGGDGLTIVALVAGAVGAVAAAGIYVSRSGSGFSLSRLEGALNRASQAMNILGYVANANTQANKQSFWSTMMQRFKDFQDKFAAIENEKEAIRQVEKERARRVAAVDTENKLREMLAAPLASGESLEDKYNKITKFMQDNGITYGGSDYEELEQFIEENDANPLSPALLNNNWSAARATQLGKEFKEKYGLSPDTNLDAWLKEDPEHAKLYNDFIKEKGEGEEYLLDIPLLTVPELVDERVNDVINTEIIAPFDIEAKFSEIDGYLKELENLVNLVDANSPPDEAKILEISLLMAYLEDAFEELSVYEKNYNQYNYCQTAVPQYSFWGDKEHAEYLAKTGKFNLLNEGLMFKLNPELYLIMKAQNIDMGVGFINGPGDVFDLIVGAWQLSYDLRQLDFEAAKTDSFFMLFSLIPFVSFGIIKKGDNIIKDIAKKIGIKSDEAWGFIDSLRKTIGKNFDNLSPELMSGMLKMKKLGFKLEEITKIIDNVDIASLNAFFKNVDLAKLDDKFFTLLRDMDNQADLIKYINKADGVTEAANRLAKLNTFGMTTKQLNDFVKLNFRITENISPSNLKNFINNFDDISQQVKMRNAELGENAFTEIELVKTERPPFMDINAPAAVDKDTNTLYLSLEGPSLFTKNKFAIMHEAGHLRIDLKFTNQIDDMIDKLPMTIDGREEVTPALQDFLEGDLGGMLKNNGELDSAAAQEWYNFRKIDIDVLKNQISTGFNGLEPLEQEEKLIKLAELYKLSKFAGYSDEAKGIADVVSQLQPEHQTLFNDLVNLLDKIKWELR